MGSFKSGERVTIFGEQESRRGREEVVSYTALIFSGFGLCENGNKNS